MFYGIESFTFPGLLCLDKDMNGIIPWKLINCTEITIHFAYNRSNDKHHFLLSEICTNALALGGVQYERA